ncbi:MAG TPA: type III-B CRISPR module-associated protein Cmr5 [Thermoanaerobaculia bacterium]|jgi:CRISPR type III-B/RAMP module-associated protein Cmr5|nr:type III-B CRISPR module-associated protein Cmr5 [Thermoanaerobaculia bacterium]
MPQTLEQMRATFALQKIDQVKSGNDRAKYKTQLLKLPARLHNNGLGQTVAFYLTAGPGKPEWIICDWLQDWLSRSKDRGPAIYPSGKNLIACVSGKDLSKDADAELLYRQASDEARAIAVWLKRFAEAFIAGNAG